MILWDKLTEMFKKNPEAEYRFELSSGTLIRSAIHEMGPDYLVLWNKHGQRWMVPLSAIIVIMEGANAEGAREEVVGDGSEVRG